ncbi:hypothetical protein JCM13664_08330 [Methylothermus subterraneus]
MRWLALWLAWGAALAQEDLLQVGKTPAEKLEQETQKAKDNVEAALQKYEQKKQLLTQALKGRDNAAPAGQASAAQSMGQTEAAAAWQANVEIPDPTQADLEFQRQFRALLRGGAASSGSGEVLPPMPQIALAAKVEYLGRDPVALLRIDGQDFLVRTSDTLSFLSKGQPITIQVREVNQHAVKVIVFPHNLPLTLQ